MERFMKTLDRRPTKWKLIALNRFTISDIVAVVGLDFARMVHYRAPAKVGG